MSNLSVNIIGKHSRIQPPLSTFSSGGLKVGQGAQILRIPQGSAIRNLNLAGGASHQSKWAGLRGGVLKCHPDRKMPVQIDGGASGFNIPTAHTLMDGDSLDAVRAKPENIGVQLPFWDIRHLGRENLILMASIYCHPDQLFLDQRTFSATEFLLADIPQGVHMMSRDGDILFLEEAKIVSPGEGSFNILEEVNPRPSRIVVQLIEGGQIILWETRQRLALNELLA